MAVGGHFTVEVGEEVGGAGVGDAAGGGGGGGGDDGGKRQPPGDGGGGARCRARERERERETGDPRTGGNQDSDLLTLPCLLNFLLQF